MESITRWARAVLTAKGEHAQNKQVVIMLSDRGILEQSGGISAVRVFRACAFVKCCKNKGHFEI